MHILNKLIHNAEQAAIKAVQKPPYLPSGYMDEADLTELRRIRVMVFTQCVEDLRAQRINKVPANTFARQTSWKKQLDRLEQALGRVLPETFRSDVLDIDMPAQQLVESWFPPVPVDETKVNVLI